MTINLPFDSFTTDFGRCEMFDKYTRQLKHDHVCEWINENTNNLAIGEQIQVPCSTHVSREYIFRLTDKTDNILTFEWLGKIE
jgi:hypothetical protein